MYFKIISIELVKSFGHIESSENLSATAGEKKIKSGFKNYSSGCPADCFFTIIFLKHSWLQIEFVNAKAGTIGHK